MTTLIDGQDISVSGKMRGHRLHPGLAPTAGETVRQDESRGRGSLPGEPRSAQGLTVNRQQRSLAGNQVRRGRIQCEFRLLVGQRHGPIVEHRHGRLDVQGGGVPTTCVSCSPYEVGIRPPVRRTHEGRHNMRLIMLTRAMESSAEVLPSLGLLAHHVRVMAAEPTALLASPDADALLVDGRRDLPAVRGLTRLLRQSGVGVPIILVTTEGGLPAIQWDWGMDEVLVDTTSPAEVEARLRLAISRIVGPAGTTSAPPEEIQSGDLHIDEASYSARLRGRSLDLTFKEFELLKFLAQHPGRVFTRAVLLQEVWGYDYFGGTRTVDVHVRRLRAKLGPEHEALIGTVRNVGYRFVPDKADAQTMATLEETQTAPAETS